MRRVMLAMVLALASVAVSAQAPPQPAQRKVEPPGAISGVVIDGTTGEPVNNASVTIAGGSAKGMLQTRQLTDAKGRFVFINIPAGLDYTLSASATGYFAGPFNRDNVPTDQKSFIPPQERRVGSRRPSESVEAGGHCRASAR